ncbi:hypothetical protein KIPB_009125, partial [Kipferlia bialata]|eukprot:g9125.t1
MPATPMKSKGLDIRDSWRAVTGKKVALTKRIAAARGVLAFRGPYPEKSTNLLDALLGITFKELPRMSDADSRALFGLLGDVCKECE